VDGTGLGSSAMTSFGISDVGPCVVLLPLN